MRPVFVDVAKMLEEPGGQIAFAGEVELSATKLGADTIDFKRPMKVELMLTNTGDGLVIKGHAEGSLGLHCSRCLEPVVFEAKVKIDEIAVAPGGKKEDEDAFSIDEGKVDLTPIVYQNIMLEVPMGLLCQDECRGICSTCGQNLNDNPHSHEETEMDERLAPLKKYFENR